MEVVGLRVKNGECKVYEGIKKGGGLRVKL